MLRPGLLAIPLVVLVALFSVHPVTRADDSAVSSRVLVKAGKTDIGTILVNSKGLTLYYWEEEKPGTIACTGGCAVAWPPLLVPRGVKVPRLVKGIKGSFGTITRPDGKRQVSFNHRALYLYQGDVKPGDTNCQAQENWYVIKSNGKLTGPSGH